jgi:hypothetical protein
MDKVLTWQFAQFINFFVWINEASYSWIMVCLLSTLFAAAAFWEVLRYATSYRLRLAGPVRQNEPFSYGCGSSIRL